MILPPYIRRKIINYLALGASIFAMIFGLFWLIWILWTLTKNGIAAFSFALFTETTPAPNSVGGLANAILGSFMMSFFATLIGTPIGVLAGTYLSEFGQRGWLAPSTRFVNDILLSAPSIVLGLFIYGVYVVPTGHFSGWAGVLALSIIVIPVVVRTTENILKLVPGSLREAAAALGTPQWKVITLISWRAAKAGIITGILLAIARIGGETAPLIFTALNNQFFSSLNEPTANLPNVIYRFATSHYENWNHLAWAGAFLVTLFVLLINILARFFTRSKH